MFVFSELSRGLDLDTTFLLFQHRYHKKLFAVVYKSVHVGYSKTLHEI